MESEPIRDRDRLLAGSCPEGHGFRVVRSPHTEDEAARAALGWKPGGRGDSLGIRASVFRAWMMKPPRGGRPFEAGWVRQRAGGRVLRHPHREGEATRVAAGLNPAGRATAGDQGLHLPRKITGM